MWLFVFFDLPVVTKKERDLATRFRKSLLKDGFSMFQFSIYLRYCSSKENMEVHKRRVQKLLPPQGHVGMLFITDKQFGLMELYTGQLQEKLQQPGQQLELF